MKHDSPHQSATRTLLLGAVAATLACLFPGAMVSAQQRADMSTMSTEIIKVTNVSLDSAFTLAQGVCQAARRTDGCVDVSFLREERMLAVTATPPVITRIQALLAEFDRLPETRSFQIVVLSADRSGSGSVDVPANVSEALEDLRTFLPYTGFSVLGTGWLRTSAYGSTTLPGPMELDVSLSFRPTADPTAALLIERFNVTRRTTVNLPVEGGFAPETRTQSILQTTFTINPGETVVVGTSKLNGDDTAMVVLLTVVRD